MLTPAVQPSNRLSAVLGIASLLAGVTPLRAQAAPDSTDLPPAGFGTLRQDDLAIRIATENLQLRVLPLDERVTRLLASDTYASLNRLFRTKASDIERLAIQHSLRRPSLFLVTFFGLEPRAQFAPEDVTITSQNRLFRPAGMVPISVQWSERELSQRETVSAIYLFEEGIALFEPLLVSYGVLSSNRWEQSLRSLEQERIQVYSRAAAAAQPR